MYETAPFNVLAIQIFSEISHLNMFLGIARIWWKIGKDCQISILM